MTNVSVRAMWLAAGLLATTWGCTSSIQGGDGSSGDDPNENVDPPGPPDLATEGCGVGVIASGLVEPRYLALAGDHVVVATTPEHINAPLLSGHGDVVSVALDGSSTQILASGLGYLVSLAAIGDEVFVASIDDPIRRVPLAGGAATPVPGVLHPGWYLQSVGGKLYFGAGEYRAIDPYSDDAEGVGIFVLDPASGVIDSLIEAEVGGAGYSQFATDGATLYYTRMSDDAGSSLTSLLERQLASGNETVIDSGYDLLLSDLVVMPDRIVYATIENAGNDQLSVLHERASAPGSPWQDLDATGVAYGVVGNATSTYWNNVVRGGAESRILRVDRATGVVESVPVGGYESDVIACPGGVCWVDPVAGTVSRWVECSN